MNAKDLILKLLVVDNMSPALKKAGTNAAQTEKKTKSLTSSVKSLKMSYVAAAAAIAGVVMIGKKLLNAYAQQEMAEKKLAGALRATGQYTAETQQEFLDFTSGLQRVTKYGDEATLQLSQLAISMGLTTEQAKTAVKGAIGLSAAYGIDANTAMRGVSLALRGQYTLLNRYIPTLRTANTEEEKRVALMKALSEGYSIALEEANTTTGKLAQAQNELGDAMEKLGEIISLAILPALESFTERMRGVNKILSSTVGLMGTARDKIEEMRKEAEKSKIIFDWAAFMSRDVGKINYQLDQMAGLVTKASGSFGGLKDTHEYILKTTNEMLAKSKTQLSLIVPYLKEELNIQEEINGLMAERGNILANQSPLDEFFIKQQQNLDLMEERYRAVADTFTGAFEGAFSQWIKGSKSLGEALKDSLLNALADVMAKYLASKLFGLLLGVVGGPGGFLVQGLGSLATASAPSFSMAAGGQPAITIQNYQASPFATSSDEMAKELIYSLERRMDLQGRFNR